MTWMQTLEGRKWDLLNPSRNKINWAEIAVALGRIPRFNGHTNNVISVAEHCCHVSDILADPFEKLAGLLHDAHEFVVGDMGTPVAQALATLAEEDLGPEGSALVKRTISQLKERQDAVLFKAAGLPWPLPAEVRAAVKKADQMVLMTERRDQMREPPEPWALEGVASVPGLVIERPWTADRAGVQWLSRLHHLMRAARGTCRS